MLGPLRFEHGSRTDVGCVRTVNEDAYLTRGKDCLWAVADGMGGHARGRWASTEIIAALDAAALPADLDGAIAAAQSVLERVNRTILRAGQADGQVIGSTVTTLVIRGQHYAVLWAGDSRVYRLRGGALSLLTTDHSQVEQMVAAGLLTREEAEDHPMAHMLSRAIGVRADLTLDWRTGDVLAGDVFLLCSDGLTRTVYDHELPARLGRDAPWHAASALVELALARGAADNVTVVVVACDETTRVVAS